MLPVPLRWQEDSPGAFPTQSPSPDPYHSSSLSRFPPPTSNAQPRATSESPAQHPHAHHRSTSIPNPSPFLMFTTDLNAPPTQYPCAYDVQVALLRTRYYYTKYLIHRPYLYKALHSPDTLTPGDAAGVATCLRAALKWPVTMSPACTRKRLIPCLYFWTQNVLGVLLVLYLTRTDLTLQRIVRGGMCGESWDVEVAETVGLYVDWLRDLSVADPAAAFGWNVVRAVYGYDER